MSKSPWHVSVLIPARNEEDLLPDCLRSVLAACSRLPFSVTCDVIVSVDSSTDRTQEIAKHLIQERGAVVCTQGGVVGQARALAADIALKRFRGARDRCWLANTDADCTVAADWLNQQLVLAAGNVEAAAGTIDVIDFAEHDADVEERFRATYLIRSDGSHQHVHGANFGVRADAYLRAGGWRNLPTAEDHDLWDRLSKVGARKISTGLTKVVTSGRRIGRAPHGFADALAAHNRSAT